MFFLPPRINSLIIDLYEGKSVLFTGIFYIPLIKDILQERNKLYAFLIIQRYKKIIISVTEKIKWYLW